MNGASAIPFVTKRVLHSFSKRLKNHLWRMVTSRLSILVAEHFASEVWRGNRFGYGHFAVRVRNLY
jgi:hypothetical protein